jgi:type VI secretion system protein ImpK
MSERPKDGADPDATVMIPARGGGGDTDPDSTVMMPAGAAKPAIADADATVMIGSGELDPDATIAIPTPGRKREPAPAPAPAGRAASAADLGELGGLNPLVAAANPILAIVPQIRHALRHSDPEALRRNLREGLDAFKREAQAAGIVDETIDAASFALCALLDESAASTPWGTSWTRQGLLQERHGESEGGLKFFAMLEAHMAEPGPHLELIEFLYVCLALGFEGKYRGAQDARQQLVGWRARVRDLLRQQRPLHDGALAGQWRGENAPDRKPPGLVGLALAASAAALVLVVLYLTYSFSLGSQSDPVARDIAQLKIAPPAGRVAAGASSPEISKQLADEIARGEIAVADSAGQSTIVIRSDHLFASGAARIEPALEPIVLRIAEALERVPGSIVVTGHTDNVPIRTARFPSNWELSAERAASVVGLMAKKISAAGRMRAEGLADSEPLGPNDSAINRARNRRVAIILRSPQ